MAVTRDPSADWTLAREVSLSLALPKALPEVTATIGTYRVNGELWAIRVSEGQTHTPIAYVTTSAEAAVLAGHLNRWLGMNP